MGVLSLSAALAGPPGALTISPESTDAPDQYTAWASGRGAVGAAARIACEPITDGAFLLCLRVEEGDVRRYVHHGDLGAWELSHGAAVALAAEALDVTPWEPRELEGGGTWFEATVDTSSKGAALVRPDLLPGNVLAAPSRSTLVSWTSDGGELDHILLVAVHRAFEAAADPVSPVAVRRTTDGWAVFGQARPAE